MGWISSINWFRSVRETPLSTKLGQVVFGIKPEIVFASFVINLLSLALPIVILQLYDRIIPQQAVQTLIALMVGLLVVCLFDTTLKICRSVVMDRLGADFELTTTLLLMERILHSDLSAFEESRHSEYLDKFKSIERVREIQFGQNILSIFDLPFVVIFFVMIWVFAGYLVLIPMVLFFVFIAFFLFASKSLHDAILKRDGLFEKRHNFLIEVLQGMQTLKPLAMESQMLRRHERMAAETSGTLFRLAYINNLIQSATSSFSQIVIIAFVTVGAVYAVNGDLSIGALAAGSMLSGRILQPATRVLSFWMQWQTAKVSESKIIHLLNLPQEPNEKSERGVRLSGNIELLNVCFHYKGEELGNTLENLSLTIEENKFITITGENGCGKSTLVKLLLGIVDPQRGDVRYDDRSVTELNKQSLRNQIGVVPQRGMIFAGTILDNLTGFRKGEAVTQALDYAHLLGLNEDLTYMPNGLETEVDSSAANNMPEGLRQRIVMVRALIGNPKILILDDANTGYDKENFSRLFEYLKTVKGRKTIILITQHPALMSLSDHCYKMKDGNVKKMFSRVEVAGSRSDTQEGGPNESK
ncbi:peptidase domain-containing ABC transporter [Ketobacter nezhaii]|uniref:peptidase domain-containing ABC transporter n=1 Tax=Ketobacter sp. MCCC 1A13808 TaxID=2602738 RepID=UPI0018DD3757|nr:ABC transporter transmembrane domain-containing protein [Ketobacter sp. MCCC 1A13808]